MKGEIEMANKNHSNVNDFSSRLRSLIKNQNLTLKAVSKATRIPNSTLHDWTISTVPTDFLAARRLAAELGVSFTYLMTGESDFTPENMNEIYDRDHVIIDGIAEIKIVRLIPKTQK